MKERLNAHLSIRASGHETEGAECGHKASIRRMKMVLLLRYACRVKTTDANSGVVRVSTTHVVS